MEETKNQNPEAITGEETKQEELVEPYNPLDPAVVFDPEYENSGIAVKWQPVEGEEGGNADTENPQKTSALKTDAIDYPLIKLNNTLLQKENIADFKLIIRNFLPKIHLVIKDYNGTIQTSDLPGVNNVITVIITAPIEGTNKKISMDFYITDCKFNNGEGTYEGEFKRLELQRVYCKQIGDAAISTYDMLQEVAKDCKLGFAATPGCDDISDVRWRQIYSQTYNDFILKQLEFAGMDENSVMDAWIDNFGYLVMANLSKLFNDPVNEKQLVIKQTTGIKNDSDLQGMPEQGIAVVQRLISNSTTGGGGNLTFEKFEPIINNKELKEHGTLNTLYYMTGPCETNTINTVQTQIIENSVDGIVGLSEYEYTKDIFVGIDMSDDGNQVLQKQIVEAFKLKYFNEMLTVELPVPNYSLQRGMLLCLSLLEYDEHNKRRIIQNISNAGATAADPSTDPPTDVSEGEKDYVVLDESTPLVNPATSGIYYINGIEFIWNPKMNNIHQKLFLVKRGIRNKLTNKYTMPKINE